MQPTCPCRSNTEGGAECLAHTVRRTRRNAAFYTLPNFTTFRDDIPGRVERQRAKARDRVSKADRRFETPPLQREVAATASFHKLSYLHKSFSLQHFPLSASLL
ncbi:hypothetical protein AMELA_G00080090 [Ameiurus melas]|uniref:Uncharacterized protein n=1 Tax=Ameiurus melas TaxID=219545 RepID=A0A7J6B1B9_AMEME|nr:hypothetical protein AMELA_G00080090 [Ameiurus melas]